MRSECTRRVPSGAHRSHFHDGVLMELPGSGCGNTGYLSAVPSMYTNRTWRVCCRHIIDVPGGYFVKMLAYSTTTYPPGNPTGLWCVLWKCAYWVLVRVNYVYNTKEINPCLPHLWGVNWRVNYKSDPYGPSGFCGEFFVSELIMNSPRTWRVIGGLPPV